MGLNSNKIRRLWLPSLLILLVILTLSLLLSSLIYPNNIQGNSPKPTTSSTPTATLNATIAIPLEVTTTKSSDSGDAPTLVPTTSSINCTYTITYWQINPQAWLIENVVIGNNSYTKAEAIAILESNAPDEKIALLQQFFAALLNTLKGADSKDIEATLIKASDWIIGHPAGVEISDTDRQQALLLAQTLMLYNIGGLGPGHCPDEPVTPTPTPTATSTATQTPTVTPIRTLTSPTAVPEDQDRRPTATEPGPEPTDAPTNPPPPPTNTPKPQPTNTPRPTPTPAPTEPPPTEPPPAP